MAAKPLYFFLYFFSFSQWRHWRICLAVLIYPQLNKFICHLIKNAISSFECVLDNKEQQCALIFFNAIHLLISFSKMNLPHPQTKPPAPAPEVHLAFLLQFQE